MLMYASVCRLDQISLSIRSIVCALSLLCLSRCRSQYHSRCLTHTLLVHTNHTSLTTHRWRRDPHQVISLAKGTWKELQSAFVSAFKQRLFATLCDFDDHLDDVSKDPMNPHLQTMGKMALPGQMM